MKRRTGIWFKPLLAALLLATLALAGCEGDDGSNGTPGAGGASAYEIAVENGFTGTEAEWLAMITGNATATTADIETCGVCHASVEAIHAITGVPTVSAVTAALNGADLEIKFNLKVDGVNNDNYGIRTSTRNGVTTATAYVNWADATLVDPALITNFQRTQLPLDSTGWLASNGSGNYTITVPAANVIADSTYLFRLVNTATGDSQPVVVAQYGAAHLRDLVTNVGCANCHGDFPAWSEKFEHYAVGGSECQICHSIQGRSTGFISKDATGAFVEVGPIVGTNLTEYIHGIHNSHNMPDGTYYRTTAPDATADAEDRYSVGFPSAMNNCRVCHTEDTQLADVAAAPVSYYLCMTCHNNWDGFVHTHDAADGSYLAGDKIFTDTYVPNHRGMTPTTDCMDCHGTTELLNEVADFHDDFQGTDSHYNSYYRGEDISFANNDEVTFAITDVTSNGSAVSFTWEASKLGAAVNPCNTDLTAGPSFQGLGAYLAYAKGDDWVNEGVSTTPGQPAGAKNLFGTGGTATNPNPVSTTCAANVATTTGLVLDPDTTYADKVVLAIGGKAKDNHAITGESYFIRESSPTYAFDPATGAAVAARRDAVANEKCLACHQGSLYQHGGDRVDNEQLCVICHNPSSNDKNNRAGTFAIVNADGTVNTDATYDGKNAETYDMRVMIHAIHGVSKRVNSESTAKPWTIYRSRGIYSFVPSSIDPVTGMVVDYPKPTGWPADGMTIYGSTNNKTIAHNWTVVHYPKPANDCAACHNDEAFEAADQTKAVALTVDPGTDYSSQADDIVIGPTAAACTACHATATAKVHTTTPPNGYKANVTKDAMLEKAAQ